MFESHNRRGSRVGIVSPGESQGREGVGDCGSKLDELRNDGNGMAGDMEEHWVPGVLSTVDPALVEDAHSLG